MRFHRYFILENVHQTKGAPEARSAYALTQLFRLTLIPLHFDAETPVF
jgi:hypothetical protein